MKRLWVFLFILIVVPRCSDKPFEDKVVSEPARNAPAPSRTTATNPSPLSSHQSGSPAAPSHAPEKPGTVTSHPNPKDPMAVTLELRPACAERGTAMTLTIKADPHAGLSMAVGYSDHQAHGSYGFGDTDENGVFIWNWVIPVEAPFGEAGVLVAAGNADGKKGGTNQVEFVVARQC